MSKKKKIIMSSSTETGTTEVVYTEDNLESFDTVSGAESITTEEASNTECANLHDAADESKNIHVYKMIPDPVEIKAGSKVMLKRSTLLTVTNQMIPSFAYRNTYVVGKMLADRVIITAGAYKLAVKLQDIELV